MSYRAANLNIASLLGYLGKFLSFFQNFVSFNFQYFLTVWDLSKNLVEHNTFIPSELQSCKFKYRFLTRVPRKVFERFSKFCFFCCLKFFSILPCDVFSHSTVFFPCGLPGGGDSRVNINNYYNILPKYKFWKIFLFQKTTSIIIFLWYPVHKLFYHL